jgi:hypothetical protein
MNFLVLSYTCCSDRHASPYWTFICRWISMGFTPSLLKKRITERSSFWCMLQAGPPPLHYYFAVVLHSSIILPPVSHSSYHEYHYCQLTKQTSCVLNFYCTFEVFIWISLVNECTIWVIKWIYHASLCIVLLPILNMLIWRVPLSRQTAYSPHSLFLVVIFFFSFWYLVCNSWSYAAIVPLSISPFRPHLDNHRNMPSSLTNCLSPPANILVIHYFSLHFSLRTLLILFLCFVCLFCVTFCIWLF